MNRGADVSAVEETTGMRPVAMAYSLGNLTMAEFLEQRGGRIDGEERTSALKIHFYQQAFMQGMESITPDLPEEELAQRWYDAVISGYRAAAAQETNPYQKRFEALWIGKAEQRRYVRVEGETHWWQKKAGLESMIEAPKEIGVPRRLSGKDVRLAPRIRLKKGRNSMTRKTGARIRRRRSPGLGCWRLSARPALTLVFDREGWNPAVFLELAR